MSRFDKLGKRVLVAAVAIPAITWLSMAGGYYFFLLIAVLSSIALHEFYRLMEIRGASPLKAIGMVTGALVNGAFVYEKIQVDVFQFFSERGIQLRMFSQLQFLLVIELVFVVVILAVELFRKKGSPSQNLGTTMLGVFSISLFFGTLIGLRELFSFGFPVHRYLGSAFFANQDQLEVVHRWGGMTIVSLFASIWICDTAAYFAGSAMGTHKLLERVSPGKTWEGAIAGFLGALATMVAAQQWFLGYLTVFDAILLGLIIGVFGQAGDLVESHFKRDAGVKDASGIIPGHGGVYDRFDSLVFVSPLVYLYIDFIVLS